MTSRRFRYRFIGPDGAAASDTLLADNRSAALRRLARGGRTVLDLTEVAQSAMVGAGRPKATPAEAVLVLQQMAVMIRAGVDLLEAIEIAAGAVQDRPISDCLRATITALRQGDRLEKAWRQAMPFYPPYVYALIGAGEASGRLAAVLAEAAQQMAFERRVGRDIKNALVYPGFLVASGLASVTFLFYVVVPRFAEMLRNARADLNGFSALVINTGVAFHEHALLVLMSLTLLGVGMFALAATRAGKQTLSALAYSIPGLNTLMLTRMRASWSKIMAMSLAAGVDVLQATLLATSALPESRLRKGVLAAVPMLRSGRPVDEAFLKTKALSAVDASLIRAGQRSGAMGEMFRAVAERNDEEMRDALKRFTLIVEPAAIAIVASLIGTIVLGLVSALASIYDSIG